MGCSRLFPASNWELGPPGSISSLRQCCCWTFPEHGPHIGLANPKRPSDADHREAPAGTPTIEGRAREGCLVGYGPNREQSIEHTVGLPHLMPTAQKNDTEKGGGFSGEVSPGGASSSGR
jgi:hypothetical protein